MRATDCLHVAGVLVASLALISPARANHCRAGEPCWKLFPDPHPSADKGWYWVCDWPDGFHYRCYQERADTPTNQCIANGSIIAVEDQSLGQRVPISGTPFSLRYQSDRVPGRAATFYTRPFNARDL